MIRVVAFVLLLCLSGTVRAQPWTPNCGNVACVTVIRWMTSSVAIPAIPANSLSTVSVPMPGLVPGDNVLPGLAAGSVAMPATVTVASVNCVTAGTGVVTFVNEAGGLSGFSTATTVTMNFTAFH